MESSVHIVGKFYLINAIELTVESVKQGIKKNWIFFIIIIIAFLADRLTKSQVIDFFLSYKSDSYYFNSFLNFPIGYFLCFANFQNYNSDYLLCFLSK